jgi:microcystin-dependent protein
MSEPYVGEIRMFAGSFAPRGWALCDGQLLAVSQNDALFSLLGTTYGGDARTTFGLPDMRGRLPIHKGDGPGLTPRTIGTRAGTESVTLSANALPSHGHDMAATTAAATSTDPQGAVLAQGAGASFYSPDPQDASLAASAVAGTGGNRGHTNMMPSLCVSFIIALVGIYPSRH